MLDRCVAHARAHRHPELREQTVWSVFEAERPSLVPYVGRFNGFHAVMASVSKTCLVRFDNVRYPVSAHAVGRPVEVRAYADRIELRQGGKIVGEHPRHFGRDQTVFDPWHYVPVLARKRQHESTRIVGDLLTAEISEKQARSIRYQISIAKLPLAKDVDDFASDGTPINHTLVRDLAAASSWRTSATSCWSVAPARARPTSPSPSRAPASAMAPAAGSSTSSTW